MANVISNFLKGRAEKKSLLDAIVKNYGEQLHRGGYGYAPLYREHDKPHDIYRARNRLTFGIRNQYWWDNPTLRMVIDKKVKEVNRNGQSVQKIFVAKCMRKFIEACESGIHDVQKENGEDVKGCTFCPEPKLPLGQEECGEEFETEVKRCVECGFPTKTPIIEQKIFLRKIQRKKLNKFNRNLSATLKQIGLDAEKHDNGFMVSDFLYFFEKDKNGNVPFTPTSKKWIQSYQGQPEYIRPIIAFDGTLGTTYFTCIYHRDVFLKIDKDNEAEYSDQSTLLCDIKRKDQITCGMPLQKVEYVYLQHENSMVPVRGYIKDEIQHLKIYSPSTALGISMIDSLYYTILQLNGQERWIAEYYLKMRMFKGFIDVPRMKGTNHENIQLMFAGELIKWRQDPWYIALFSSPEGSSGIKFHKIEDSPKEMQMIENREESRRQISTAYDVSNIFMNDASVGAGLNNQGLELAVTNRAVKYTQISIDEQILIPWCASIMDIDIDELEYVIAYNTNEEQDLMAEKQRRALDIASHAQLQQMGAAIKIDEKGELTAASPKEGEALIPGSQEQQPSFDDVEGTNEDGQPRERRSQSQQMEGSPNEPRVQGSGLTVKGNGTNDPFAIIKNMTELFEKLNGEKNE